MERIVLEPEDIRIANEGGYYYLASPYSKWPGGLDDACEQISRIAGRLIERGLSIYAPIPHSHTIAKAAGIDPFSHKIWLAADKPVAHGAYGIIVAGMFGWRDSFGIGEELKWFKAAKKPAYLLDPTSFTLQVMP
jgi:hypothetical protein